MATLIPSISTCASHMTNGAWRIQSTNALHQRKLPFNVRKRTGEYNPAADAIQIMAMKVSKGLEFPVVTLPRVGHMPKKYAAWGLVIGDGCFAVGLGEL